MPAHELKRDRLHHHLGRWLFPRLPVSAVDAGVWRVEPAHLAVRNQVVRFHRTRKDGVAVHVALVVRIAEGVGVQFYDLLKHVALTIFLNVVGYFNCAGWWRLAHGRDDNYVPEPCGETLDGAKAIR